MKVLLGILKTLSCVVYAVIIVALAIAAPMLFGYNPVIVLSGSMLPDYPVGSITYYKSADFSDIEIGDAITFDLGEESLATHRVVEINETAQEFTTKGDNNETQDTNPVSYTEVQGKTVDLAIPYAGYFIAFVKSWYVIGICAFILIMDLIFTKDKKEKKSEN